MKQRTEERLTKKQRLKILELRDKHGLSFEAIGERFDMDKMEVRAIALRARKANCTLDPWSVTWIGSDGNEKKETFDSFEDARFFAVKIGNAPAYYVVGGKRFKSERNAMSFSKLTRQECQSVAVDVKIKR